MKKSYSMQLLILALFLIQFNGYAKDGNTNPSSKKIDLTSNTFTSLTDPGWSYSCDESIEVELISLGLKNNVPASLEINDGESIDRVVVEIVYKGNNPGSTIEILDDNGNSYTANREVPTGGSSSVWYYRTEMPATSSVNYSNTTHASYAQSMLVYVFRHSNTGAATSGVFTALSGYNNIETLTIPIQTDEGPRTVSVELPISELTPDGRYIHIEVSAADGSFVELTETIDGFSSGNCCIKIFELNMENVAGSVSEIEIKIDTRNKKNGQNVNGQSWVMAGAVKTDVMCSCVDSDTTPPTADNLVHHILSSNINELPEITFSDECSAVTIEYNEYEDITESCFIDFGPTYTDSNIWFHSFPFDKWHHWENGYFEKFTDGSAKIHGRVVNNIDPTSGWIIEIFFETLVDFNTWSASGGYIDNDSQKELRLYSNVDFTKPYTLEGFGDYTNSSLTLLSNTNLHHMDIGPRDVYGDYGIGFWISYEGTVNGQTVGGENLQHIDMYASLDKCVVKRVNMIVREWIVTDAAGNSSVFIQRVEFE
ncbi:MAG: hypothetical protein L3J20_01145 [Flavobacteriaceae bacterium]|nr:hypothetical protein [Flavobacteriaceae bacterium]